MKKKYLLKTTLFVFAAIVFGYAILKEHPVPIEKGDSAALAAYVLGIGLVLVAIFGKRIFKFFSSKNSPIEQEDPTIDSFRNNEEWKEFVSDHSH